MVIPRMVEIHSPRLAIVYWSCNLLVLTCLIVEFALLRSYMEVIDMSQYMSVVLREGNGSTRAQDLHSIIERGMNAFYCRSPAEYDFWYNPLGTLAFRNATCMTSCAQDFSPDCITRSEVSKVLDHPPRALIVSSISDEYYAAGKADPTITKGRFIPGMEEIGIAFNYMFEVPTPADFGLRKRSENIIEASTMLSEGKMPIETVVVDWKGEIRSKLSPARAIKFTVAQLLEMAGDPSFLDTHQPVGVNYAPGGKPRGPLGRIIGGEVRLAIECFNNDALHLAVVKVDAQKNSLTCTLQVSKTPKTGAEVKYTQYYHDFLIVRTMRGIEVVVTFKKLYGYVDYNMVFNSIVSVIVLLGLPVKFVTYLTLYFLGRLSAVYARVLREPFEICSAVRGMTVRLVANSVTFMQLTTQDSGGISRERLRERLSHILSHRREVIDESELEALVNFCFLEKDVRSFAYEVGLGHQLSNLGSSRTMSIDDFSIACASREPVNLEAVVDLFDRDRKPSFMERAFTPRSLWNEVHHACGHAEANREADKRGVTPPSVFPDHTPAPLSMQQGQVEASRCKLSDLLRQVQLMEQRLALVEQKLDGPDDVVQRLSRAVRNLEAAACPRPELCKVEEERGYVAMANTTAGRPSEHHFSQVAADPADLPHASPLCVGRLLDALDSRTGSNWTNSPIRAVETHDTHEQKVQTAQQTRAPPPNQGDQPASCPWASTRPI